MCQRLGARQGSNCPMVPVQRCSTDRCLHMQAAAQLQADNGGGDAQRLLQLTAALRGGGHGDEDSGGDSGAGIGDSGAMPHAEALLSLLLQLKVQLVRQLTAEVPTWPPLDVCAVANVKLEDEPMSELGVSAKQGGVPAAPDAVARYRLAAGAATEAALGPSDSAGGSSR